VGSVLTSQLLSVITLLAVLAAPLPMLLHILSRATVRPRVPAPLAETMLMLLVLWTVVQSLVVVLLGWVGYLKLVSILVLEGALLVWGLWLISREHWALARGLGWDLFEALALPSERSPAERSLLAITCGVALLLCLRVLTLPISEWDSLDYQLPRVAQWYQRATFAQPMDQWGPPNSPINSYPYNWNTLFFLALAPVGHDQFVLMPNVLAWVILGVATYSLGRLAGGHRFGAMFAAVLVLLMPLSIKNVSTAHNDLPLGALFVASVYFTVHSWRYKRGPSLLMALLSIAMMAGTKMTGLTYTGLVAVLSLWLYLSNRLKGEPGLRWVEALCEQPLMTGLVVVSIGLLGSWYVHNALVTGNPLGCVQISILGRVLLSGEVTPAWVNKTNLLNNFSLMNPRHWEILRSASADFLGLPGFVLAVLALAAPYQLIRRPRVRPLLLVLFCLCLLSLYFYIAGPWSAKHAHEEEISGWLGQQMRYTFPFWGLVGAIAGVAIRVRSTGLAAWGMVMVVILGAIGSITEGPLRSSKSALVLICVALLVFFASRPVSRRYLGARLRILIARPWAKPARVIGIHGIGAVSVILITLATGLSLEVRYKLQDALFHGINRFVDDLPADTRIGFWNTHQSYLLYGKRLQRSLVYLPLHENASSDDMLRYLYAQPVDVIAVGPLTKFTESSPVWAWITEKSQHFERLHGEDPRGDVLVYRLSPSGQ
jgi:hypothetical protein